MIHDDKTSRGKADRHYSMMKINFDPENGYEEVLKKSQRLTWPGIKGKFYLSDGSGSSIQQPQFEITGADGSTDIIPWTLENFIKISNAKFPSRTRLYCVRKELQGKYLPP